MVPFPHAALRPVLRTALRAILSRLAAVFVRPPAAAPRDACPPGSRSSSPGADAALRLLLRDLGHR